MSRIDLFFACIVLVIVSTAVATHLVTTGLRQHCEQTTQIADRETERKVEWSRMNADPMLSEYGKVCSQIDETLRFADAALLDTTRTEPVPSYLAYAVHPWGLHTRAYPHGFSRTLNELVARKQGLDRELMRKYPNHYMKMRFGSPDSPFAE